MGYRSDVRLAILLLVVAACGSSKPAAAPTADAARAATPPPVDAAPTTDVVFDLTEGKAGGAFGVTVRFTGARDVSAKRGKSWGRYDFELQHGDAVVANAGTILLDALVNDRPAVCVLYDEGAPPDDRWAELNVSGEHYRTLLESEAFYRARSFDEVAAGIERALADPAELAAERARVARSVVGEVDGHAADRVADVIVRTLAPG